MKGSDEPGIDQGVASARLHPRLPIFSVEGSSAVALYTPGMVAVVNRSAARLLSEVWAGAAGLAMPEHLVRLAGEIGARAQATHDEWQAFRSGPFSPECLTLAFSSGCSLSCSYCYGDPGPPALGDAHGGFADAALREASRLVARRCADNGVRFQLALHGWGEPTAHWVSLVRAVEIARVSAAEAGVDLATYVATSGVIPEDHARWLGRNVDRVGLSCDGPPAIQDLQRPLHGGGASSARVEATARAIRDAGGTLSVRATVTPRSVRAQSEIVAYAVDRLGAAEVRLEPAFLLAPEDGFAEGDDRVFVEHLVAAQRVAGDRGCEFVFSGVRRDQVHGPFCDVVSGVVRLWPDGTVTSCFKAPPGSTDRSSLVRLGGIATASGKLDIDWEHADELRRRALEVPDSCRECVNLCHCARSCPDSCLLVPEQSTGDDERRGFRCRAQRRLTESWLRGLAEDTSRPDRSPVCREGRPGRRRRGRPRRKRAVAERGSIGGRHRPDPPAVEGNRRGGPRRAPEHAVPAVEGAWLRARW